MSTAIERLQEYARANRPVQIDDPEAALRAWAARTAARQGEESDLVVMPGSPAAAMAWAVQEIDLLRGRLAEARERAELAETRERVLPQKVAAVVRAAQTFSDLWGIDDGKAEAALLRAVKVLGDAQLREPAKAEG